VPSLAKLRPAKVRSALRRRWFENRMERLESEPMDGLQPLGSDYGYWVVPVDWIDSSWTCYCVGAGGDITFERELLARYAPTVRSFEPDEDYVGRIEVSAEDAERFSAYRMAITPADGPIRMQRTHIPGSRSLSPVHLYETEEYVEVPGRSLRSLMEEFGDDSVELLKVDVEGGEYELVPTLDLAGMGVRVFCIQLHHTGTVRDARGLVEGIRDQGFRYVNYDEAVRLTFVRD
jgi:FkbM family methyltransferase